MSYPPGHHHRSRRRKEPIPTVDIIIFVVGLIAAAIAGVVAYQIVGPYGDGPLNANLYRTTDPETGRDLIYREVRSPDGKIARYYVDDATRKLQSVEVKLGDDPKAEDFGLRFGDGKIASIERDTDHDGRPDVRDYFNDPSGLMKTGFSLLKNGIIDAWAYRDKTGALVKIEISRGQDGKVDRWEYYDAGQLSRVEQDDDHDGKIDRWMVYDAGILMGEAVDRDRDGKPDTALPVIQP